MIPPERVFLPKTSDRLPLGKAGLKVSPICVGRVKSPATVEAAFEAGINFFFVSADLHWPLYEPTRKGLRRLLEGNPRRRNQIVVGVVSYFEEPWFGYMQFWEVIDAIPGLKHVDLLIAGGVSSRGSLDQRAVALRRARANCHLGARAAGASLHQRKLAVQAEREGVLDITYIRYNAAHPGARRDVFPHLEGKGRPLLFNFKNVVSAEPGPGRANAGTSLEGWIPRPTDYYRFVLSEPLFDGLLCKLASPKEVRGLVQGLEQGPLSMEEQTHMIRLCTAIDGRKDW